MGYCLLVGMDRDIMVLARSQPQIPSARFSINFQSPNLVESLPETFSSRELKIIRDCGYRSGMSNVILQSVADRGESIGGHQILDMLDEVEAQSGLNHALYLLNHQSELPEQITGSDLELLFPGTVVLDVSDGRLYIPKLANTGNGLGLQFDCLDYQYGNNSMLVTISYSRLDLQVLHAPSRGSGVEPLSLYR